MVLVSKGSAPTAALQRWAVWLFFFPVLAWETCFESNMDYHGHDVPGYHHAANAEACQALCQQNQDCEFFTYATSAHPVAYGCWFKTSDAGATQAANVISGPRACEAPRNDGDHPNEETTPFPDEVANVSEDIVTTSPVPVPAVSIDNVSAGTDHEVASNFTNFSNGTVDETTPLPTEAHLNVSNGTVHEVTPFPDETANNGNESDSEVPVDVGTENGTDDVTTGDDTASDDSTDSKDQRGDSSAHHDVAVLEWHSCTMGSHCVITAGETWWLDMSVRLKTLTVKGTLRWDTSVGGLELRAGYISVEDSGLFEIGTKDRPMEKNATVFIEEGQHHDRWGTRFLFASGNSVINIHGRRLGRTWSLLAQDVFVNQTKLRFKHSLEAMGWRVGDTIGIATTSRDPTRPYKIVGLGEAAELDSSAVPCVLGAPMHITSQSGRSVKDDLWSATLATETAVPETWQLEDAGDGKVFIKANNDRGWRMQDTYGSVAMHWASGEWEMWTLRDNGDGTVLIVSHAGRFLKDVDGELQLSDIPSEDAHWKLTQLDGSSVCRFVGETFEVSIDPPLMSDHMGGVRRIMGENGQFADVEMAAEVVNLERSVLITGEPNWDTESKQGLHTGITGTGHIDVRYARVENCGQRPIRGKYCLHMHLMHQCPKCVIQGNSVVNSTQVGITVHGTHNSLVDQNVIWNAASVGIYVEDGNEMNNTISSNTIICMHRVPGSAINPWHLGEHCQWDLFGEAGRLGGIFVLGMTNDFIDNRIVNMENGVWFKGTANPRGNGAAENRLCPTHVPFGKIRGNVCHDNRRFGMYPDVQMPRMLKRDDNGMLVTFPDGGTDWSSCDELTPDGKDNGVYPANVIEDQLDYHNTFVGQYAMTDVEYRRYTGVNNRHCMYWKSSKNFVDKNAVHIRDSRCITDPTDHVFKRHGWIYPYGHVLGPAGGFTFRMQNMSFIGDPGLAGSLSAGQHCMDGGSGGPCNVQYLLEDVDFTGVSKDRRFLNFGVHAKPPAEVLPVFLAKDESLGGYKALVSKHLEGFANQGCAKLGKEYDYGYACDFSVRRFNIWSKQALGIVKLLGPGYEEPPDLTIPTEGQNAGILLYADGYNGYGGLAIPGRNYTLEANLSRSDIFVDFSDQEIPEFFNESDEEILMATSIGECEVKASGAHGDYFGRYGPVRGASQGSCSTALGFTCKTSEPGDDCWPHIKWAQSWGIRAYPDKFPGLTTEATVEEVQQHYYNTYQGGCPAPCPSDTATAAGAAGEARRLHR